MTVNKTLSLFLFITFFISLHGISTTQIKSGVVLDEKLNKPIEGVNVYLKNLATGTTTNEKGEFFLKHFFKISQNDTLYFSIVGYVPKKVAFADLKRNGFVVLLTADFANIKEVTIVAKKQLQPQIRFKKLAPLPNELSSFGSLLLDNKIWVMGGDESIGSGLGLKSMQERSGNLVMKSSFVWENYSDRQYVYDIPTDKWVESSLKFSKRAYHNIHYFNGKIYVLGGKTLSDNRKFEYLDDKIEVFNIEHNSILVDNTNPHQAVNFASVVYNDNIIVMGGSTKIKINDDKEYSSRIHLLNLKTGLWYEIGDMLNPKETKGILVNNYIYVIGGYNLKPLDSIEKYNIATGEWTVEGQLFQAVERPALALVDNIIYIFENGRIQTYNVDTKQLTMYSIDLPLKSCELFYADYKLYIFGGSVESDIPETAGAGPEKSKIQSSGLYSIDLSEFRVSEIYDTKTF
jgi:hypothetical protein